MSNKKVQKKRVIYHYGSIEEQMIQVDEDTERHLFYLDESQIEFIQTYSKLTDSDRRIIRDKMYKLRINGEMQ